MRMTLADVAVLISGELIGEKGRFIERIASLHEADGRAISFLADETSRHHLETTQAAAVIVPCACSRGRCNGSVLGPGTDYFFAMISQLGGASSSSPRRRRRRRNLTAAGLVLLRPNI